MARKSPKTKLKRTPKINSGKKTGSDNPETAALVRGEFKGQDIQVESTPTFEEREAERKGLEGGAGGVTTPESAVTEIFGEPSQHESGFQDKVVEALSGINQGKETMAERRPEDLGRIAKSVGTAGLLLSGSGPSAGSASGAGSVVGAAARAVKPFPATAAVGTARIANSILKAEKMGAHFINGGFKSTTVAKAGRGVLSAESSPIGNTLLSSVAKVPVNTKTAKIASKGLLTSLNGLSKNPKALIGIVLGGYYIANQLVQARGTAQWGIGEAQDMLLHSRNSALDVGDIELATEIENYYQELSNPSTLEELKLWVPIINSDIALDAKTAATDFFDKVLEAEQKAGEESITREKPFTLEEAQSMTQGELDSLPFNQQQEVNSLLNEDRKAAK
jgi:hypothetical protein